MANLADRPSSPRGARRRQQLVDAGVAVLAEGGWPAVTSRAVAERAGANVGLIHYHFGGLPALHAEIACRAGEQVIGPVMAALVEAPGLRAAVEVLRGLLPATAADVRITHLATELMAGAQRDPALGEVLCEQLRQARDRVAERMGELHPQWSPERRAGMATLAAALFDGLILHRMLDSSLPTGAALSALDDLVSGSD